MISSGASGGTHKSPGCLLGRERMPARGVLPSSVLDLSYSPDVSVLLCFLCWDHSITAPCLHPLNWSPLYSVMSPISLHDVKLKATVPRVLFRSWLCITTFPAPYSVCRLTARSQSLVGLPRHHPWRFHFSVLRKSAIKILLQPSTSTPTPTFTSMCRCPLLEKS